MARSPRRPIERGRKGFGGPGLSLGFWREQRRVPQGLPQSRECAAAAPASGRFGGRDRPGCAHGGAVPGVAKPSRDVASGTADPSFAVDRTSADQPRRPIRRKHSACRYVCERAFKTIPSVESRSTLLQATMEISPISPPYSHWVRNPLNNDPSDSVEQANPRDNVEQAMATAWSSSDHLDVAMNWGRLRNYDLNDPTQIPDGWNLPVIKRSQDGNPAMVAALAPLGSDRIIAVFNEGSVGTYRRGTSVIQVDHPQQGLSVYPIPHAVAISKSGALIALATIDQAIILYRCNWGLAPRSTPACEATLLDNVQGRALAISSDEKRLAVGDASAPSRFTTLLGPPRRSQKSGRSNQCPRLGKPA